MDNSAHISFNASDRSYFAILKKDIHKLITDAGFGESKAGKVDIVVAEMASNLVKHAGGGEILVRMMREDSNEGVELISIDNGPGMSDTKRMIEDGMSTTNTLGHGFGAMKRMSDVFEVYSMRDWGTIVLSRIYRNEVPAFKKKDLAEVRSVIVAKSGEKLCGDGAFHSLTADGLLLFLGDGLGHGPEAHKAVQCAIEYVKKSKAEGPIEIIRRLHPELKKTRGIVGTIAIYGFKEKKWRICGVGNITTRVHSVTSKTHMSYNGVIGMNVPNTMNEQVVDHERGQTIVMCSDGIKSRWEMLKYTGIFKHDLSILAAAIYKDFARKTDDMSVLAARINAMR